MNEPKLFLGGSRHGRRYRVAEYPVLYWRKSDSELNWALHSDFLNERSHCKIEEYQLQTIAGDKEVFSFYALSALSIDDCIRMLLENY